MPTIFDALKEIGAVEAVAIVEKAISELGVDVKWEDEMARKQTIHNLPKPIRERLWGLDSQFNKHIDQLPVQLYNYLLKHRHEFNAPNGFWEGATIQ